MKCDECGNDGGISGVFSSALFEIDICTDCFHEKINARTAQKDG